MEESLAMLRIAEREGIRKMMLTPHYIMGQVGLSVPALKERFADLKARAEEEGIQTALFLGNEIYYMDGVTEKLKSGRALTLNGTDHVLIEFEPDVIYTYVRNAFQELMSAGYKPILAHVERYENLKHLDRIELLHELGVEIQSNAGTFAGILGRGAERFVFDLMDRQLIDYIGTDAHGAKKRTPELRKCINRLAKKYDVDTIQRVLFEKANRLMG